MLFLLVHYFSKETKFVVIMKSRFHCQAATMAEWLRHRTIDPVSFLAEGWNLIGSATINVGMAREVNDWRCPWI